MAKDNRNRVALSLDDEEHARALKIAGVVPLSSWATIAVREKIVRIETGQIVETMSETERDALRALRWLSHQGDGGASAIIGAIAGSMYSSAVRERLVAFAIDANALLEGHVREVPGTPQATEPQSRGDHPKKGKG